MRHIGKGSLLSSCPSSSNNTMGAPLQASWLEVMTFALKNTIATFMGARLPYDFIQPDVSLRELLLSIPQRTTLFTNSDQRHATKVLQRLAVEEDCFQRIICFETMNPHLFDNATGRSKSPVILEPSIAAMEMAVRLAGVAPHGTLFLDNNERNIATGKAVGLRTALDGKHAKKTQVADYLLSSIAESKQVIPTGNLGESTGGSWRLHTEK